MLAEVGAKRTKEALLPTSPDGYQIKTSENFKPPQGFETVFNPNDPALAAVKSWAHKHSVPQSSVSELMDVYANVLVQDAVAKRGAYDTEVGKLGASGPGRIDALALWLKGTLGDKGVVLAGTKGPDGRSQNGVLWNAAIVDAFEALQQKYSSQGASSYTGNGRDNGASDGKIVGYDKMSFAQRRQAQDQQRQQRGAR